VTKEDAAELLASVPGLTQRAMFGGISFYSEGKIFAIWHDDALFLKGDDKSIPDFLESGAEPFTYLSDRGLMTMRYYRFPTSTLLLEHLDAALETAKRTPEKKPRSPKR
jgi:TfoX/Sxy family transcriptional regulator of competence genes